MQNQPKTLIEAVNFFSDKTNAVAYLVAKRWPNGVTCKCGSTNVTALKTRQLWQCKDCRKQFSVKVGTIFEDSSLPLNKWLTAAWLIMNCRNGVSSCEISRSVGVTQKTAWFMLHRIRECMKNGSFEKLSGTVESDSTYIGGIDGNRHEWKKYGSQKAGGKTIVFGAVERGGKVRSQVVDGTGVQSTENDVLTNVAIGSTLYSDEAPGYRNLGIVYEHATVNHAKKEYVRKEEDGTKVHTNTIENYWSLVKRALKGTYIHVEPFHLDRYLDEQGARYDLRKSDEHSRFAHVVANMPGRRLTYKELTGKVLAA